jgi:hypothetical protein
MSGIPGILLNSLYIAEPAVMAVALFALLRSKDRRRFGALVVYLLLRLVSVSVLEVALHARVLFHLSKYTAYQWYFYTYWSFYIAGTIAVFFIILELFKFALEPLPGLKRLGLIAFRWVACVSCVAALASAAVPEVKRDRLIVACDQLMRCESIFLLSLLFFLMVAAGKLGLSYRSRVFGVCFGFGIMAASNLVASSFLLDLFKHQTHIVTSALSIMDTGASILTLIVWSAYFFREEPVRHAIAQPGASPLSRWNEIALVLSPSASRIAVANPSSDFFLQDVEKVVDRILSKNSLNAAS